MFVCKTQFLCFFFSSYFYEDKQGLFDETQFVYDLELPVDFVPEINDDEVLEFYLWTIEEVRLRFVSC